MEYHPDIFELADRKPPEEAHVAVSGTVTGVALPDKMGGAVLNADYARKLGAQLILAADEHDVIYDRGFNDGMDPARHDDARGEADR